MIETNEVKVDREELIFWRGRFPGYSIFLAVTQFFGAQRILPARIIQIVVDSLACLFIYGIGLLIFDHRVGLWSAWMYAFWLPNALVACMPNQDSFMSVFILSSLYFFILAMQKDSWRLVLLTAFILIIGTHMREEPFMFPVVWGFGLIFWKGFKKALAYSSVLMVLMLLGMAPYIIRNYRLEGRLAMLTPHIWDGIYSSIVLEDTQGRWGYKPVEQAMLEEKGVVYAGATVERMNFCKEKALRVIREDPWWYVRNILLPQISLFTIFPYSIISHYSGEPWLVDYLKSGGTSWGYLIYYPWQFFGRLLGKVSEGLVFLLAVLGIWLARSRWTATYVLWITPLYYMAGYLPIKVLPSYLIPPKALLLVLAAYAVITISKAFGNWRAVGVIRAA
ncbi:MAG: glycosyltransferase family 39 protein [Elusimicrobia bacterium]|nr:glycosyltransferase family 39 protein [Elusimicrobiota bacterium]